MAALRTAGPGIEIILGQTQSILQVILRLRCYASRLCLAFSSLNNTGMLQKTFCVRRARLNVSESARILWGQEGKHG